MSAQQDNKRIAKNTIYLYIRQIVIMLVSLYTFRIVLELLGVDDYGTYNVIGGVVVLFSFLSGALTQSTQRYLSYYIGKSDWEGLRNIFSMSVNVHALFCILILLIAETVGLWFVNTQLEFPKSEPFVINVVYQCSVFTVLVQIIQIPYRAAIISYERMNFFAYLSVVEALLKLAVVGVLFLINDNRLIAYAFTLFLISLVISFIYRFYSRKKLYKCQYKRIWNKEQFKELTGFVGWNTFGALGNVGAQQGLNILFNIFCGVVVNAAMGVAVQVNTAVNSFVSNFQIAFNPRLIKLYASKDYGEFTNLLLRTSRISFFLIYIIGFPIIICCKPILEIWLTEIPEYSVVFIQLMLIYSMIDAISGPLWTAAQATGKIRTYMIIVSSLILLNIPIAYVLLKFGISPVYVILVRVILNFITHNFRIFYLKHLFNFPILRYYKSVMLPVGLTILFTAPFLWFDPYFSSSFLLKVVQLLVSAVIAFVASWFVMLTSHEREIMTDKIKSILSKWTSKKIIS